jgi:hypothetical protein
VPVAVVVWTFVVLLVLGAGAWLGDRGPMADSQYPAVASAVVVSSLACTDGTGTTLVDVLNSASPLSAGPVRATLDACGYQEGQQLSVQFATSDPAVVVLAGAPTEGAALLPLGVAIAALLALGAGLAVWIDSRRRPSRHRAGATGRHLVDHETQDPTADPAPERGSDLPIGVGDHPGGDAGDRGTALTVAGRRQPAVELSFPFSSTLAASLHDELFTHRTVSS